MLYYIILNYYIIYIIYIYYLHICRYCILLIFTYYILCILCICTYRHAHAHPYSPVCVWVWENESRQFSVTTSNASLPSSARAVLRAKASSSRTLNVTMALLLWERLAMANAGISHVFALFQLFNRAFWYLRVHFCVGRKVEDLPSSRTYLHLVFSE